MPEYDYECNNCSYVFSIVHSMAEDALTDCPQCHDKALQRVILSAPHCFVKGEANTVGQLADRNTAQMGRYELEDRRQTDNMEKHKKDKEIRARRHKINTMTPEQQKKWIMEGD